MYVIPVNAANVYDTLEVEGGSSPYETSTQLGPEFSPGLGRVNRTGKRLCLQRKGTGLVFPTQWEPCVFPFGCCVALADWFHPTPAPWGRAPCRWHLRGADSRMEPNSSRTGCPGVLSDPAALPKSTCCAQDCPKLTPCNRKAERLISLLHRLENRETQI